MCARSQHHRSAFAPRMPRGASARTTRTRGHLPNAPARPPAEPLANLPRRQRGRPTPSGTRTAAAAYSRVPPLTNAPTRLTALTANATAKKCALPATNSSMGIRPQHRPVSLPPQAYSRLWGHLLCYKLLVSSVNDENSFAVPGGTARAGSGQRLFCVTTARLAERFWPA